MKLSLFAKPFPARELPFVEPRTGVLAFDSYDFMRALFNRTGGPDGLIPSIGTPLTATGANFAQALVLTDDWNEVLTTPAGSGIAIPKLQATQQVVIFNGGVNALLVYPQPGTAIDAIAAGSPFSLAPGKTQIFSFWGLTRIRSLQLG